MCTGSCFSLWCVLAIDSGTALACEMYPNMVFLSRYTRWFDALAICIMAPLLTADQWQTVRAITNMWNAFGASGQWTSSAITTVLCAWFHGRCCAVVTAGALSVATCTAISRWGGIQHFLIRYNGTDSATVLSTEATERWAVFVCCAGGLYT